MKLDLKYIIMECVNTWKLHLNHLTRLPHFAINGFSGLIYHMTTDWSLKSYIQIMQVESMEEVIALYNSIPPAMVKNCMLFLMRQNIKPMWEDPNNKQGGCFSFKVGNKNVPDVWKSVSYLLTGETLSKEKNFQDNITGITISPKSRFVF